MTGVAKIHQGLACEGAMTDNEIKACKSLLLKLGDDDDSNDEEPEEMNFDEEGADFHASFKKFKCADVANVINI